MANRDATPAEPNHEADTADVAGEACCAFNAVGRYANFFKVGTNALEVVIEFGEAFSDGPPTPFHTRIVTHPVYARALLALLDESLPLGGTVTASPSGAGDGA